LENGLLEGDEDGSLAKILEVVIFGSSVVTKTALSLRKKYPSSLRHLHI